MKLVTVAQMRELEQAAVAAGTTEAQMMEEAGLAVAQEAWMLLGTLEGRRIVVLVGPGRTAPTASSPPATSPTGAPMSASTSPARASDMSLADELDAREIPVVLGEDDPGLGKLDSMLFVADLVIDALLGIGKKRPLDPEEPIARRPRQARGRAQDAHAARSSIAVDIPTGIDADTGAADPLTVEPDLTVTFGLPKVGLYQEPASARVGQDPGHRHRHPEGSLGRDGPRTDDAALGAKRPAGATVGCEQGHLRTRPRARRFAAATPARHELAATAAYRAGAGLVTIGYADTRGRAHHRRDRRGDLAAARIVAVGHDRLVRRRRPARRVAVVPGGGDRPRPRPLGRRQRDHLGDAWPTSMRPAAWSSMRMRSTHSRRWPTRANACRRTPCSRRTPVNSRGMLGTTVADVQSRRIAAAQEAATKYRRGRRAQGRAQRRREPGRRPVRLSPYANPLLATAGSGDMLAGMIGGYLAQGLSSQPMQPALGSISMARLARHCERLRRSRVARRGTRGCRCQVS